MLDLMEFKDWDLTNDFFPKDSFEQEMKDSATEITTNSRRKEVTEKDYMNRTKDLMLKQNQLKQGEAKYHVIKNMLNTLSIPEEEPLPIFKKQKMKTQTCGRLKDLDDKSSEIFAAGTRSGSTIADTFKAQQPGMMFESVQFDPKTYDKWGHEVLRTRRHDMTGEYPFLI